MTRPRAANPALPCTPIRSFAMIGIVFSAFGFVLNEMGKGLTQLWLVPYADTISALGFVIALYTAALAGLGTRLTVLIGLIYGIGIFYVSEPDATYVASGLKISSYNTTHLVGLGLIGFTMILLIALAFYLTRAKSGHRTLPKQDPGSTS